MSIENAQEWGTICSDVTANSGAPTL